MATPTPTPVVPTALPAVTAPVRPPRGKRGHMTFSVQRLPEPLLLEQDVVDPIWHRAMFIGFIIASILVFYVYGEKMFLLGRAIQTTSAPVADVQSITPPVLPAAAPSVQQNSAPQPQAQPQPPTDPTAGMNPEDRRLYERLVLRK